MKISIPAVRRSPVLLFFLLVALAGTAREAAPQPQSKEARVAIILGNAPAGTDEPTAMQTARCLKAYELYENGTVNTLLVTGGFTRDHISEARMMKIALVTYGVAPEDVIEDELASTTIENGLFAAKLFEQHGWPKSAVVVSQAFHLPRAGGIFKKEGFEVRDATAADAPKGPGAYALVLGLEGDTGSAPKPADVIIVYEPYDSQEPLHWPTPALAKRLRVAAALYHRKAAPSIVLYNDRYTRGPVNIAQTMKVALVSLGVPAESLRVIGRNEYRWLGQLAETYGDKSAIVVAPKGAEAALRPRWAGSPGGAGAPAGAAAQAPGASGRPAGAGAKPPAAGPPPAGTPTRAGAASRAPAGTPGPPAAVTPPARWMWVYVE